PPGSSLKATNDAARIIDAKLRALQVSDDAPNRPSLHFVRRSGRAELDEHAMPVSTSEYIISVNPAARHERAELVEELREELREEVPGVDIESDQPLAHMINHMVSGV